MIFSFGASFWQPLVQVTGLSWASPMFLSQEFFGFILSAILKPGINALSQGALAGPVWGEVLGGGNGQFFPLRLTKQWVYLTTQQKYMAGMDLGFHQQKMGTTGTSLKLSLFCSRQITSIYLETDFNISRCGAASYVFVQE